MIGRGLLTAVLFLLGAVLVAYPCLLMAATVTAQFRGAR